MKISPKTIPVIFLFVFYSLQSLAAAMQEFGPKKDSSINPLLVYSKAWSDPKYKICNTADNSDFLTNDEKNIIWVLNMVRMNPKLFLNTVLLNPNSELYTSEKNRNHYFKSLITCLQQFKSINEVMYPDRNAYLSAFCHAKTSGEAGYVGHQRRGDCEKDFYGECCQYGYSDPVLIVLALLIDDGVPSLGHRNICLSESYTMLGVSIQPHSSYRVNAVLDFK